MSNCIFGWPIHSDHGVLHKPAVSGGAWVASLPLANVQDRRLSRVARSADATLASTTLTVDLGVARAVRVLALLLPNASAAATVTVTGSNNPDLSAPVYSSAALTVRPAGFDAETLHGSTPTLVVANALGAGLSARYWRFAIDDTTNPAGYVDVARLVVAGGWQPSINMSYGARLGLTTNTEAQETDGGATLFNERPRRRLLDFDLGQLPEDEAMSGAFDMQRLAGTAGQLFFVFDPQDSPANMHRRAFLCTLRSLTAVEYPYFKMGNVPFQLVEEL